MVVFKKPNGKLRICLDPKDLNASIKRKHHYLPRREDISSQMAGAKIFSKLDSSQGIWQIKFTEQFSGRIQDGCSICHLRFRRLLVNIDYVFGEPFCTKCK